MEVVPGYNPAEKRVTLEVRSELLRKYYSNLFGLIQARMTNNNLPTGTKIEQIRDNIAVISFPLPAGSSVGNTEKSGVGYLALNSSDIDVFHNLINGFANAALRKEMKSTEFVPLSGYPVKNLMTEVRQAVENKRNLCIIDTYENYLKMKENDFTFQQVSLEYGTFDYAETVINLFKGNMKAVKDKWESKLTKKVWA